MPRQSCKDAAKLILGALEISSRSVRFCVTDLREDGCHRLLERFHAIKVEQSSIDRLTAILLAEAEAARDLGASRIEVTAETDLRGSRIARLIDRVCESIGAEGLKIPNIREHASAAFAAVTSSAEQLAGERVGVAAIAEKQTGLAIGIAGSTPDWIASRPIGPVSIATRARFSKPPRPVQLETARSAAASQARSLMPPPFERLFVASSVPAVIERLCGPSFGSEAAARGADSILGLSTRDMAAWFALPEPLSATLPAVLVAHAALAEGLEKEVEPVAWEPVAGRELLRQLSEAASAAGGC